MGWSTRTKKKEAEEEGREFKTNVERLRGWKEDIKV